VVQSFCLNAFVISKASQLSKYSVFYVEYLISIAQKLFSCSGALRKSRCFVILIFRLKHFISNVYSKKISV